MLVSTGFTAMAIDMCSEICSIGVSPRISFSHDLDQIDVMPIEQQQYNSHQSDTSDLLDFVSDFDFCISECIKQEPASTADELFSNGKILPMEIKKKVVAIKDSHQSQATHHFPPQHTTTSSSNITTSSSENEKKMSLKELLETSSEEENHLQSSKPFWKFRRSSSLNCDNARSKSLIQFRSLNFLSRSNSTGSASKLEKSIVSKTNQKQHLQNQASSTACEKEKSPVSSSSAYYPYGSSPKPPLKKNKKNDIQRSYGNGIRISPVLNIPPHYISKGSVSLFGFGSIFYNGKDKKKKK